MVVPDETRRPEGKKSITEIRGYQLCTHCSMSPINHQRSVRYDGRWFCQYEGQWKAGNDILQFGCKGYRRKDCANCRRRRRCDIWQPGRFCDRYRYRYSAGSKKISGRISLRGALSDESVALEKEYWDRKEKEIDEYAKGIGNDSSEPEKEPVRPEEAEEPGFDIRYL